MYTDGKEEVWLLRLGVSTYRSSRVVIIDSESTPVVLSGMISMRNAVAFPTEPNRDWC